MKQATKNELRCECRRRPLLAMYGLDDKGGIYVHVKIYKSRHIYGEILVLQGIMELRCRECLRWYRLVVPPKGKPQLIETEEPDPVTEVT